MFLDDEIGVPNCLGVASPLPSEAAFIGRLTLVKPELTAVKPPELMAVNPDETCDVPDGGASDMATSRSESLAWPFIDACSASVAILVGDSARRLEGV